MNEEESESEYSSDERGMSEAVPFSIRDKVKVWWPAAKNWYRGVVTDVDQVDQTYEVHYQRTTNMTMSTFDMTCHGKPNC